MTPLGWLALAAAALVCGAPAAAPRRLAALSRARRVGGDRGVSSRFPQPAPGRYDVSGGGAGGGVDAAGGGRSAAARLAGVARAGPFGVAAAAVAACAVGAASGPACGSAAAAIVLTASRLLQDAVHSRAVRAGRNQLLAAVRMLVAELAAGSRPGAALTAAAQVAPQHAEVLIRAGAAADTGGGAAGVLGSAPATARLGTAWALGEQTGAALGAVLQRVAADVAAADEQHRAVAVALSGPRASAAVLAGLPVVGIAMGAAMGARPVPFLLFSPAGRLVCCAGVLLDVAGLFWTRRIIRHAERGAC